MTTIFVTGIPMRWDIKTLVRKLIKTIKGQYEVVSIRCTKASRVGCVRLSELLDPRKVVQCINSYQFGPYRLQAFIPDVQPDLPPHPIKPKGKIPLSLRRAYGIINEGTIGQVLHAAHTEIIDEMQCVYAGLYKCSLETGHELMDSISKRVLQRMRAIMTNSTSSTDTGYKLTLAYRRQFPHSGDFMFIQNMLNNVEKAQGKPLTQLDRDKFTTPTETPHLISEMTFDRAYAICRKFCPNISEKLQTHISELNTNLGKQPTAEDLAAQKVRLELKKILPYIPLINDFVNNNMNNMMVVKSLGKEEPIESRVRQAKILPKNIEEAFIQMVNLTVQDNIKEKRMCYYRMRLYGEPFMPNRDTMSVFLKKFKATKIYRSDRTCNLLFCKAPITQLPQILAADGTNIGGATIRIRLSDIDYYQVPEEMKNEMLAFKNGAEDSETNEMNVDEEWNENW